MNVTYLKDRSYRRAYIATTKALAGYVLSERQQVEDLGDMLIGALIEANLAEPLDGEEFDDLSDGRKSQMRETM